VAAQFKTWVCGRSLAGIAGSNPVMGVDVFLVLLLYVVRRRSRRRADPLSRGFLLIVCMYVYVCVYVCVCVTECNEVQQYPLHLYSLRERGQNKKEGKEITRT
jgi:hypothetical protein